MQLNDIIRKKEINNHSMKKSTFFDYLNRRTDFDFSSLLNEGEEDQDYINWNDFLLPSHYGDSEQEYTAIRESAAMFDVSPIRKIRITGRSAGRLLDHTFTRPVSQSPSMRGIYVAYCNEDGSLKDDSILYKFADDDYLLMPSDIDHTPHLEFLRNQLAMDSTEVSFAECTDQWSGLAVQGPSSAAVIQAMGFQGVEKINPFEVIDYALENEKVKIARMGFTADLGYECWFKTNQASIIMDVIDKAKSKLDFELIGYGLNALEVCRLEGGFVVAGWDFATELDPDPDFERSPYEVGLGWLVNLRGGDFVGKQALISQQDASQKWVHRSIQIDVAGKNPEQPLLGALYIDVDDREVSIGSINCSAWSWGLRMVIGNAAILSEHQNLSEAVLLVDNKKYQVRITQGAHINLERRNKVPAILD